MDTKGDSALNESTSPTGQTTGLISVSFILTLVALALSFFCVALYNVIVVATIPRITYAFHSVKDIGW
jgi:hypothetical protein